jgi:hypothetical protein
MGRKARLDLVLDCADAEQLTAFWQAALGYRLYFSGRDGPFRGVRQTCVRRPATAA